MNTPLHRLLLPLLTAVLLASHAHGQYTNGQYSSYTMYYQSGPPWVMRAPSGGVGFEVPIERAGHYFRFNYRTVAGGAISSTSASSPGFVTSSAVSGASAAVLNAAIRSFLVTAYTPSSYVSTPVTYTYPATLTPPVASPIPIPATPTRLTP